MRKKSQQIVLFGNWKVYEWGCHWQEKSCLLKWLLWITVNYYIHTQWIIEAIFWCVIDLGATFDHGQRMQSLNGFSKGFFPEGNLSADYVSILLVWYWYMGIKPKNPYPLGPNYNMQKTSIYQQVFVTSQNIWGKRIDFANSLISFSTILSNTILFMPPLFSNPTGMA